MYGRTVIDIHQVCLFPNVNHSFLISLLMLFAV